jgi:hypothetical protein
MSRFAKEVCLESLFAMIIAVSLCACGGSDSSEEGDPDSSVAGRGGSSTPGKCNPDDEKTLDNCSGTNPCCTESGECGEPFGIFCLPPNTFDAGAFLGGDGGFTWRRDSGFTWPSDGGFTWTRRDGGSTRTRRDGGNRNVLDAQ